MQLKFARAHKSLDFVKENFNFTPLLPGHKPLSVMIDNRSSGEFHTTKVNKDRSTLKVRIF